MSTLISCLYSMAKEAVVKNILVVVIMVMITIVVMENISYMHSRSS